MRFLLLVILAATPLAAQQPETLSLLEEPLYPPPVAKAERARLESEIVQARADVKRDPSNADAALRLARAERGLGRIGDALETLTRAIDVKTDTAQLRIERGRGFIAIRKFDLAQREFRRAAETAPEAHCDLGFALYLSGDFVQSHSAYGKCADPGLFGYLAAKRAGAAAGPPPTPPADPSRRSSDVKLPGSVASKPRSESPPLANAYMDAVDHLLADRKPAAKDLLKPIVEKHKVLWMEPLYVAAEADYARIVKAEPKKKKRKEH